jgi:hypothetical protein
MGDNWFKWEPEAEDRMSHVSHRYTPCEVLRQIYKRVNDPEVRLMCRVATTMAKSMATRITKHEGKGWGQKIYPKNPNWR